MSGRGRIKPIQNQLARLGQQVGSPVGEIDDAFIMTERPFAIRASGLMTGIRAGRRIAKLQGL
jgi:hypothetical protein